MWYEVEECGFWCSTEWVPNLRSASYLLLPCASTFSHLQVGDNSSNDLLGCLGGLIVPNALAGSINVKCHEFFWHLLIELSDKNQRTEGFLTPFSMHPDQMEDLLKLRLGEPIPKVSNSLVVDYGPWNHTLRISMVHTLRITTVYPIHTTCVQMRRLFI